MLSVTREEIIKEVQTSSFLSIQADETTDIATLAQLVLVLRYIDDKNNVQERFFEFIPLQSATAESIASALKERLASILPEDQKSKLICQAYDGASVMRGATAGVQRKVQDVYPNAHYIHCYAHQLNLIMQHATSHISKTRIFFSNIGGFASFFSKSPKRTCFLDKVVAHRLPRSSNVRWNFHSRAINTVFEHREDLIHCFESIQDSGDFDPNTVREAGALAMLLEDDDFKFFLELYHHIMPHVDFLYAKLQKKNIDSVHIKVSIQQFQQEIQKIRNSLHSIGEQSSGSQPTKRRRVLSPEERERIGAEVCDTILGHTRERFSFTDHLVCATLLQGDRFDEYKDTFPDDALSSTIRAYPMLNGSKLKTELSLIYSKQEFSACRGAVDLFQLFMENNLEEVFSETVTLLKVIITTPMTTAEAERRERSLLALAQTEAPAPSDHLDVAVVTRVDLHFTVTQQITQTGLDIDSKMLHPRRSSASQGSLSTSVAIPTPVRGHRSTNPAIHVRFDMSLFHAPVYTNRQTCKYCSRKGNIMRSNVVCRVCKVHLCLNAGRNCFLKYHEAVA
ncbi:unnamed protein product [Leuciscus chuanchicus]